MDSKSVEIGLIAALLLIGSGCEKNRNRGSTVDPADTPSGEPTSASQTDTAPVDSKETHDTASPDYASTTQFSTTSGTKATTESREPKGDTPAESTGKVPESQSTESSEDATEDAPPEASTHIWKKRDKLDRIIRERYGFPEYKIWTDSFRVDPIADLVLERNGIKNKNKIPPGTALSLPDRENLFVDAGFPEPLAQHLTVLFDTENRYYELGIEAAEAMCTENKHFPNRLREAFAEMTERTAAFRAALESLESPVSNKLKKVLEVLKGLETTFREVAEFKKIDESFCDFSGKEVTSTKRQFSNLMYRLHRWSRTQRMRPE